jgi:4-alpha-glucanotransferase
LNTLYKPDGLGQERLPGSRLAGVGLHISSLPGPYGIGELGHSARSFIDMMVQSQLSVWQFLPLGPTAYGDSPYQPLSTFAGNEMLIDLDNLIDLHLLQNVEVAELKSLPGHFVDYDALIPIKNRLLRLAASRFLGSASQNLKADFGEFVKQHNSSWLHDYAVFRTLKDLHEERAWPEWHSDLAKRDEAALRRIEETESNSIAEIKVLQFLFFRQWSTLRDYAHRNGVTLFGDLPIYIALDSADAWANRDLLRVDENGQPDSVAGVPPDYFSEDGQLWGNPLYDWAYHARNGYSWWVKRVSATLELADLVRIDHFRGFESYWAVPADEATARAGSWEAGPGDALFDALHQSMGDLPIVAEDLGVITPEVEELRDRHRLVGMRVLQFDVCDAEFALSDIGEDRVCYTGTHDNDTTVGWFHGSPDDHRSQEEITRAQEAVLRVSGGQAETVHTDLIKAAFSTDACLAIAPIQDYLGLGSEARINTPGIAGGNWRWRVLDEQLSADFCDNVASMVIASGRGMSNNGKEQ